MTNAPRTPLGRGSSVSRKNPEGKRGERGVEEEGSVFLERRGQSPHTGSEGGAEARWSLHTSLQNG